ncbi:hypothetical protein [Cetobacterium sp.]|uniref:hypothetical protein n=1 Tax=Cetobacterium sp. TaxID=2071632 RepID=UPI003F3C5227
MAKRKDTGYSKKQLADALRMGGLEYSKKYKTSLSSHQRLKLTLLQDYEIFKALEVSIDEVPCSPIATKIALCLENLREGKNTVFEEVKREKKVKPKNEAKRRGRPAGSKNKTTKSDEVKEKIKKDEVPKISEIIVEEIETLDVIPKSNQDVDDDIAEVEVQKKPNLYDMLKNSNLSFFAEFLENVSGLDDLVNLGVENYFNKISATNERITQIFNDLYHIIEFEENVTDEEKILRYDSLKCNLMQRRQYKDEYAFLKENKSLLISFCTVFKKAKTFNERKDSRCYTFRAIGQDIGITGIAKNKDPESIKIEERMIELERTRIKKDREEGRREGNNVAIDKIEKNWKNLFHNELDTYTRTELYKEASNIYKEKGYLQNFNMLKEYIIEMEIMPELLYNKRYFLRKD